MRRVAVLAMNGDGFKLVLDNHKTVNEARKAVETADLSDGKYVFATIHEEFTATTETVQRNTIQTTAMFSSEHSRRKKAEGQAAG